LKCLKNNLGIFWAPRGVALKLSQFRLLFSLVFGASNNHYPDSEGGAEAGARIIVTLW